MMVVFLKKLVLQDAVNGSVGYMYLPSMAPQHGSMKNDLNMIGDYIKTLDN
ncbi:hypothetical protein Q5M85_18365 [Paraclostridium bifermentans]|nr:hypothetical protein [Paraclostridium bifermentans]